MNLQERFPLSCQVVEEMRIGEVEDVMNDFLHLQKEDEPDGSFDTRLVKLLGVISDNANWVRENVELIRRFPKSYKLMEAIKAKRVAGVYVTSLLVKREDETDEGFDQRLANILQVLLDNADRMKWEVIFKWFFV